MGIGSRKDVPWVEPVEITSVDRQTDDFAVTLADGERFIADRVVIATGLSGFAYVPPVIASLPPALAVHTSGITSFAAFKGRDVAVIGAGQSALEAAALLHEAGAQPHFWYARIRFCGSIASRSNAVSGEDCARPFRALGSGPKAWALTHFPGAMHRVPDTWRTRFVKNHLPAEGAWWLRDRVENRMPVHLGATVVEAREAAGRVALGLAKDGSSCQLMVDHVVAGSGYDIDVERIEFFTKLRSAIQRLERAPRLNATFETSVSGLHFIGPASAMSFGPLFRFVAGAEYTAGVVSAHLAA